jgi:hypothetical protein
MFSTANMSSIQIRVALSFLPLFLNNFLRHKVCSVLKAIRARQLIRWMDVPQCRNITSDVETILVTVLTTEMQLI